MTNGFSHAHNIQPPMRPYVPPMVVSTLGKRVKPEECISQEALSKTPEQESYLRLILELYPEIRQSDSLMKYLDENPLQLKILFKNPEALKSLIEKHKPKAKEPTEMEKMKEQFFLL